MDARLALQRAREIAVERIGDALREDASGNRPGDLDVALAHDLLRIGRSRAVELVQDLLFGVAAERSRGGALDGEAAERTLALHLQNDRLVRRLRLGPEKRRGGQGLREEVGRSRSAEMAARERLRRIRDVDDRHRDLRVLVIPFFAHVLHLSFNASFTALPYVFARRSMPRSFGWTPSTVPSKSSPSMSSFGRK